MENQNMIPIITIDGPSGSGKGTIAAKCAAHLGWHLLDSGALYRLVALSALNNKLDASTDESFLQQLAETMEVKFEGVEDPAAAQPIRVLLSGKDVTDEIRTEAVGNLASQLAAKNGVRQGLLARQKAFQQAPGLVADGRDMGTVVFPHASLKFYLTASVEERARRRFNQLQSQGQLIAQEQLKAQDINVSLAPLCQELRERDERDMNRKVAPLRPAEDARIIDTTQLSVNAVLAEVLKVASSLRLSTAREKQKPKSIDPCFLA